MCRILYSLIFVTVLLLAGYAALAGENEPSGGGTVPDGEHQVWLPVVAKEAVPSECVTGPFVVHTGGYIGWWLTGEYFVSENPNGISDTWTGIVATEPDFREESILSSGPWYDWELGHGYRIWVVSIPSEYIQIGRRYYSRVEYECLEYHVQLISSAIARQ